MADENPPVPDPTVLTTEQLLREVAQAKDLMEARIEGVEAVVAERFRGVDEKFDLVERQRLEQKKDTKDAVDAAFSAAKEAVKEQTNASDRSISKSESATKEQLTQLSTTFTTQIKAVTDSQGDLKERVQSIESIKQGVLENRTESRSQTSNTTTIIGAIIATIVLVLTLFAAARAMQEPTPIAPTPPQTVTVERG